MSSPSQYATNLIVNYIGRYIDLDDIEVARGYYNLYG